MQPVYGIHFKPWVSWVARVGQGTTQEALETAVLGALNRGPLGPSPYTLLPTFFPLCIQRPGQALDALRAYQLAHPLITNDQIRSLAEGVWELNRQHLVIAVNPAVAQSKLYGRHFRIGLPEPMLVTKMGIHSCLRLVFHAPMSTGSTMWLEPPIWPH